ncbi:MAG: aspartate dehydrogenase [Hyphomicrobiales bacterium]
MEVVIIGYGPIAKYVCSKLQDVSSVQISWVICRQGREETARQSLGADAHYVTSASAISSAPLFALDCAGHSGLAAHGATLLERGIDIATISTGAFADDELAVQLGEAAERGNSRLMLLHGAVGGIDALASAKCGGLESVTYRGRKPPAGWKGSLAEDVLDLDRLTNAEVHFQGTAREAAQKYPKNANVAATIALAGMGLDETAVELIADPALSGNVHEIEVKGAFGRFRIELEGNPLPENPRSSALAAMSLVRAVTSRLEKVTL